MNIITILTTKLVGLLSFCGLFSETGKNFPKDDSIDF